MPDNLENADGSTRKFKGVVPDPTKVTMLSTAGYRIVEEKKIVMTRQLCERVLDMKQVPGDRGMTPGHAEDLMQHMIRGTFLYELHTIVVAACKEDGFEYRINSQHCCWAAWALDEEGVTVEHGKSRYLKYDCDTLDDVRQLYSLYDRNKQRSRGNCVISNLYDTEEYKGVGQKTLQQLSTGLSFWLWESPTTRTRHDANEVAHLLSVTHLPLAKHIVALLKEHGSLRSVEMAPFRRAAVIAAMFATFEAAPNKSVEFWNAVMTGLNLSERNDPRYKLRSALTGSSVQPGNTSTKKQVNQETMYRWCIFAWNAWRRGDKLQVLRAPSGTARPKATKKTGKAVLPDETDEPNA